MQNLKSYIFLTFWFLFAGYGSTAQNLSMEGTTTIMLSYNNAASDLPVTVDIVHSFPANSDSQVSDTLSASKPKLWLSCPVHIAQEGFVYISDKKIALFMIPSDTIFISINGLVPNLICNIDGRSRQIQSYYQAKSKRFPIAIGQQMVDNWEVASDLLQFKIKADSLHALDQAFWNEYEYKKLLPTSFVRYESDAIRYANAWLRLRALSYRRQVKRVVEKEPEGYFSFLETLPIHNITALYDKEYLTFLREYVNYKSVQASSVERAMINRFANHEKAVELFGKRIGEFYIIFSISEALNDNPKDVTTILTKRSFSESNNYLIDYLRQEASRRISILSKGKNSPNFFLADSQDSLVSLSQFKGQVVYLSFWFAGCKGCVEEFPFENKLVQSFKDKPVKIISICTRTSKEKWLKTIDSFGLKTLNLYANSAWIGTLEEKFGINVYPHYVLIGEDGTIVENFTSRPSQGAAVKIQKALPAKKFE